MQAGSRFGLALALMVWGTMTVARPALAQRVPVLLVDVRQSEHGRSEGEPGQAAGGQRQQEAQRLLKEGGEQFQVSQFREALRSWQGAWQLFRELGDRQGEVRALGGIGLVHQSLGDYDQAIGAQLQVLSLARDLDDRGAEAKALGRLGLAYRGLGQYERARGLLHQQLAIARQITDRQQEAAALGNLGIIHGALAEYDAALSVLQQSLAIQRQQGNERGKAAVLSNLGLVYDALGQYQKAISVHVEALSLQRTLGNRYGEAQVLNNLGVAYMTLGDYGKAIGFHRDALAIERQIGHRRGEANSLGNLGLIYKNLGQFNQAIQFYNQSLILARQLGNRQGEADSLENLGSAYYAQDDFKVAIAHHTQALALVRQLGDQDGEATVLNSLGLVSFSQGKYRKATKFHRRSLKISRKIGDRRGEAIALGNLGNAAYGRGQLDQAIAYYQQSLTLAKALGLRGAEGRFLSNLGFLFENQGKPELAILFLKQSVNVREQIRKDLRRLSLNEQQSYTETIATSYRRLADLLLNADRVLEAQQVLDLLKVQELHELLNDVRGSGDQLDFLQPELELLNRFQASQDSAITLIQELDQLTQKARTGTLSASQRQRRQDLLQVRQALQGQFNDFLAQPQVQTLLTQLSRNAARETLDLTKLNSLQDNLAQLNGILLYPLILEDRLELVITTPTAPPLRRVVPVKRTDLNRTIAAFRSALENPRQDAITPARQLYNWLIRPLEPDLKQAQSQTILFAPDGQLRYIPLTALHNGQEWLTQVYRVINITTSSQTDFDTIPQANPRILAGAFADQSRTRTVQAGNQSLSFRGLPFAGQEVLTLAASQPNTTTLLDQDWTLARTIEEMDLHQIVHFATHAAFVPSDPAASFIVFGAGENPSLRDIATWSLSHVDLVVLSACETGLGGNLGNGVEILGLGYQFQVSGAKAVIASLWQVSDGGTQTLMTEFYGGLQTGRSKAEALRQAQIALIKGTFKQVDRGRGGIQVVGRGQGATLPNKRFAHPYYWAPFILIGNGL